MSTGGQLAADDLRRWQDFFHHVVPKGYRVGSRLLFINHPMNTVGTTTTALRAALPNFLCGTGGGRSAFRKQQAFGGPRTGEA